MRARITSAFGAAGALLTAAVLVPGIAAAAPAADAPPSDPAAHVKDDDRPDPLAAKRQDLKQDAVDRVATGEATVQTRGKGANASKAVKVPGGQWVEYGTQETAQLLTFLVDFGDKADDRFPDAPASGPVHNQIAEPDADDNSTYWESDFSQEHYKEMFFTGLKDQGGESFADVYDEMSSGRFDLQGDVSDWVTVPYSSASYGQTESQEDMTRFIQDTADAWYADQIAQGKTKDEIDAYLQSFDVWDRYDLDGDGITNEPDGYIDHFQAIHAGEGEEAGAPESAIWSHRWAVNQAGLGKVGPADFPKVGGIKIGDSDVWIRDYTTEPENGGLGVFAHEFGHDLGLPDYYDTAGGDNGTAFWNLMSSGSWLGHGDGTIGTTPNHMGATEKMFLGWLDYTTVQPGQKADVDLGPSYHATKKNQAVVVNLPDGVRDVDLGVEPIDGKFAFSGSASDLNNTLASPAFTVPSGGALAAKVQYSIEEDYDYAYVEVSTDGGSTWATVPTNLSAADADNGITGSSEKAWVDLSADLSQYAGQSVQVRFRYTSDPGTNELGFLVDDVTVGDALSEDFADDAAGWTNDGFTIVGEDGTYEAQFSHYYVAENRQYAGYDTTLKEGPYNFGWTLTKPNTVEQFPYQDGLLVWYKNSFFADNNTSKHPGGGQALPVDANSAALTWSDGTLARSRIQSFDATFGLGTMDKISLHRETENGMTTLQAGGTKAKSTFDDTDPNAYYDPANPGGSVIVGGTGTKITVNSVNKNNGVMSVSVTGPAAK
ncbi:MULTISPECIES: immune inhibitor A domain-containing protein [unclassified Isoptericola]|uniref:immune inhibitor A domain-containing protein n=1 Tax=unclassified Isoptericola TaxID=2623355 RepID=UPI003664680F